jgi:prepilin-type N-terminal cleavage/methylation domain-containing protein
MIVSMRFRSRGFTLLELLVVLGIVLTLAVFAAPAISGLGGSRGLTSAVNDVSAVLELAHAEAMSTRSYVYVGFSNPTNSDGNSELRIAALISVDGSSDTAAANLRPLTKLLRIPRVSFTNYTSLPPVVQSAADISLQSNTDYVSTFVPTAYFKDKFGDSSFDSCPTIGFSPQGEVLHSSNPQMFFRTQAAIGLVPTHGTKPITTDGAIVTYYGGTGQIRIVRPRA